MKTDPHWERIGRKAHHGIVVPLFALHTKHSSASFSDLLPLIDWCARVGFDIIQLLPLNDTGNEPSPYYACSSCALDPVYLSLHALPNAGDLSEIHGATRADIKQAKLTWLKRYFAKHWLPKSAEIQAFKAKHTWLLPYARFKALKEANQNTAWTTWSDTTPNPDTVDFHCFLQFLAFEQMGAVRDHATKNNVHLLGDVPILLNPDSADVWAEPELFDRTLSAGAPPDIYNPLGQNWGFPLFRWDVLRQQNYRWWKRRLDVAASLYHLYRIDHVVGFFRIWAIEDGKAPSVGQFVPSDPTVWLSQGRELLEMMIRSSPLLPIAEDLGTIPKGVSHVLEELGICSTKVFLWQVRKSGKRSVIPYGSYDPVSLTTVSTPDGDPLAVMWRDAPELGQAFATFKGWEYNPVLTQIQRLALLYDAHHTASLFHINPLQEYLNLFPELSWPNPEDDRINVPGVVLPTNWTYQFRPSVEEIAAHPGLAGAIARIIGKSTA